MNKESFARSICQTLQDKGYIAYYAGGYVRDLLLDIPSDDIDIATDATVETIQSLFKKTIPLGIAFGIVVVVIEKASFEVATFRKDLKYLDGRRPEEVVFCSAEEDALRRDFTLNGLFYDPIKQKIHDYVGGQKDIQKGLIKAIGEPSLRFKEDRLRMIRAARFAARFGFTIEEETQKAIRQHAKELFPSVSIERIYQELKKMQKRFFDRGINYLWTLGLLKVIFPQLDSLSQKEFEQILEIFKKLDSTTPLIIELIIILKIENEPSLENLAEYLKVSNQELKIGTHYLKLQSLATKETNKQVWAHFLSAEQADACLNAYSMTLEAERQKNFLNEISDLKKRLEKHILRIQLGKPLIQSADLIKYGIEPGPRMGELLTRAEKIVIESDFEEKESALKALKQDPLWNN